MPPHHQHPAGQPWIVAFLELRLDIVNRAAQRSGQTQRLVQAKFDLGLRQGAEISQVAVESALCNIKFFRKAVDAAGSRKGLQLCEVPVDLGG